VDERARRVAEHENLFRQVNEHVVAGGRRPAEEFEIICECADTGCMDHVRVTTESYERARGQPTDFPAQPGARHTGVRDSPRKPQRLRTRRKTGRGRRAREEAGLQSVSPWREGRSRRAGGGTWWASGVEPVSSRSYRSMDTDSRVEPEAVECRDERKRDERSFLRPRLLPHGRRARPRGCPRGERGSGHLLGRPL
jgi:hypothetical protein